MILCSAAAFAQTTTTTNEDAMKKARFEHAYQEMDANHDGTVSKEEAEAHFAKRAENRREGGWKSHPCDPSDAECQKRREMMQMGAKKHVQEMDTNHDGKISAEEFQASDKKRFSQMDLNHDGEVTEDEIKTFHQQHADMMKKAMMSKGQSQQQ